VVSAHFLYRTIKEEGISLTEFGGGVLNGLLNHENGENTTERT
jgi:hypothetical protein